MCIIMRVDYETAFNMNNTRTVVLKYKQYG